MKGNLIIEALPIMFFLVLGLILAALWGDDIMRLLAKNRPDEKVFQSNVKNYEKTLLEEYEKYDSNDGGLDAYESSILLAKAIEYAWRVCYNKCDNEREPFTNFFAKHPLNFIKDMDCSSYPKSGSGKTYPSISRIGVMCSAADLGTDKTKKIDEWTVTVWGLSANTEMCSNYRISEEDNKQWGNGDCGSSDVSGYKCSSFCDRSGAGMDKIDWKAGEASKGKAYDNIRIIYVPEGWVSNPQIIVKEIS